MASKKLPKCITLQREVREAIGGCPDWKCSTCLRQVNAVMAIISREVAKVKGGKVLAKGYMSGEERVRGVLTICLVKRKCNSGCAPCQKDCRRVLIVEGKG